MMKFNTVNTNSHLKNLQQRSQSMAKGDPEDEAP